MCFSKSRDGIRQDLAPPPIVRKEKVWNGVEILSAPKNFLKPCVCFQSRSPTPPAAGIKCDRCTLVNQPNARSLNINCFALSCSFSAPVNYFHHLNNAFPVISSSLMIIMGSAYSEYLGSALYANVLLAYSPKSDALYRMIWIGLSSFITGLLPQDMLS